MPRNRPDQSRDDKRDQIVAAAERLFTSGGFDRTSMAAVAAEVQVTKNTIYWYFADKDALLLAVLTRAFATVTERHGPAPEDLASRLEWVAASFADIETLTNALHSRLDASSAVRDWHDRFHRNGDKWLAEQIREHHARRGVPEADPGTVAVTVRLWSIAIDGMVTHHLSPDERRAICALLVSQLDAAALPTPAAAGP